MKLCRAESGRAVSRTQQPSFSTGAMGSGHLTEDMLSLRATGMARQAHLGEEWIDG